MIGGQTIAWQPAIDILWQKLGEGHAACMQHIAFLVGAQKEEAAAARRARGHQQPRLPLCWGPGLPAPAPPTQKLAVAAPAVLKLPLPVLKHARAVHEG